LTSAIDLIVKPILVVIAILVELSNGSSGLLNLKSRCNPKNCLKLINRTFF